MLPPATPKSGSKCEDVKGHLTAIIRPNHVVANPNTTTYINSIGVLIFSQIFFIHGSETIINISITNSIAWPTSFKQKNQPDIIQITVYNNGVQKNPQKL